MQNYAVEVQNLLKTTAGCDPIKEDNIQYLAELGEGSFGAVYLAEYHNCLVAVKFLKYELTEKGVNKVLEELKVMKKLKHPNIVMLMGATVDSRFQILLLTEYAKRGDLKGCLPEIDSIAKRMRIAKEFAKGLSWCHAHYIIHRDLKLENIFITENWNVKIGDFGLAIQDYEQKGWHNFRGNVKYSAPELLRERALREQGPRVFPYGEKTDVYSFGLLWYEILTRLSPFKDKPEEYKGREGQAKYTLEGHRPTPPQNWPKALRTIMASCWDEDPKKRPTFEQILGYWDSLAEKLLCPEDKIAKMLSRELWKDQSTHVSYEDFKTAFIRTCTKSKRLKHRDDVLLAELCRESITNPYVTYEQYCHLVSWFGPIDADSNCVNFFSRIRDLLPRGFFRGNETQEQSDYSLKLAYKEAKQENEPEDPANEDKQGPNNSKRYFIMKFSLDTMGEFELRWIDEEGDINSILMSNVNGKLKIDDQHYLSNWSKLRSTLKRLYNFGGSPTY
uniref:Protein kinase domain-containing protein n=1 Tax=Arcella intermedia TaxID=1963864 RepID=A0A6B2L246_9EUKA